MGMQKFKAPALPTVGPEYDQRALNTLVQRLNDYFRQLDSATPLEVDSLTLSNVPASGYNLPNGAVYRNGRTLQIVLPEDACVASFALRIAVGSVTTSP